ncbi:sulfite exporter TauE/SafE family protein [Hoyosella sp. YIM 151337]|uniref:sulfite exporter TauE/SafE family protein n=1 Tax=Hoyosella sp. YIM 151337 TaxID=2992742 RepID=UPI002235E43E|nr:sulfite exporter TauE/SafE family protein [Hoyosella sp. YIM 151337]MCW4353523.1 sulfite exporter TauE/SafE family protein [Hoyosella sp. YIM 151337]
MEITVIVVVILAVAVGLSLGLLGGGGSILMVPLLAYVAGMDAKEAIAASLFAVGVTSLISLIMHAKRGNVRWRTGLIFGSAGMAGAFLGGLLGGQLPGTVLMIAFSIMMIATAAAMIRGRRKAAAKPHGQAGELPVLRILVDGLIVGLVTGLVGAGGGFLVVPALALLGGLPMSIAVGTSLLVISMKSFAGLAGYLTTVSLDWGVVAAVTAAAVIGALVGARLTARIREESLRKGFGYFVLAMGAVVLSQELPGPVGAALVAGVAVVGLTAAVCRLADKTCLIRWRPQGV